MATKLSVKQQAQLALLETIRPKLEQVHRIIEELAMFRADEGSNKRLSRLLDEIKAGAGEIGLLGVADTAGMMAMLARRTGGLQMRVRGLREGLVGLKINMEGAIRAATTPAPEVTDEPRDG